MKTSGRRRDVDLVMEREGRHTSTSIMSASHGL
jgi:hypothetical protein